MSPTLAAGDREAIERAIEHFDERWRGGAARVTTVALRAGQRVAVKVSRDEAHDPVLAAEASKLAWPWGRGLPRLRACGRVARGASAGRAFVAYDLVQGRPVAERLPAGRAGMHLAAQVAAQVGLALWQLERALVSHGDVSSSNVIVDDDGSVGLLDLGLAGDAAGDALGGTPRYMAPELRAGQRAERRLCDRYALGVLLAELLSDDAAASDDPAATFARTKAQGPLGALVTALLSRAPHERPPPSLIVHRAARAGATIGPDPGLVRAAYVGVRRGLLRASALAARVTVDPSTAPFVPGLVEQLREAASLEGAPPAPDIALGPLDALGRLRLVAALSGPWVSALPPSHERLSEPELLEALERLAASTPPERWTHGDLERALGGSTSEDREAARDAVSVALSLSSPRPSPSAIAAAEELLSGPLEHDGLRASLIDALRRLGLVARALLVDTGAGAEALAARAEAARRAGRLDEAEAAAERALALAPRHERAAAVQARARLDAGSVDGAREALEGHRGDHPALCEVRALTMLATGDAAGALRELERGLATVSYDEPRARLLGAEGYVAHAAGDARRSLSAYREAAACAARACAVVDEASYRTGEAAAAVDAGELGEAIDASTRASSLCEAAGLDALAARGLLSLSAALRVSGASFAAIDVAREASARAALSADRRAEGYALLVMVDAGASASPALLDQADRLLEGHDRVRVDARRLALDVAPTRAIECTDDEARSAPPAARLEWLAARLEARLVAPASSPRPLPGRPHDDLAAAVAIVGDGAPAELRGRIAHAAHALAVRLGDAQQARLLAQRRREVAERLTASCPAEHLAALRARPWVDAALRDLAPSVSSGQVGDVLSLVRGLSSRERLRPLLEQVLDALLLWTGVERGVLLMPAPGDRLVARAARNLSRDDLRGEQLTLSQTLARRAIDERRTVVAVDAAGEAEGTRTSVHLLRLRSVLAVPLVARGEVLGVAYLDDRVRRGAFGPDEIAWVELVAGVAAVAIADARDQVLLRRAARREARARSRAERALSAREAELDALARSSSPSDRKGMRNRFDEIVGHSPSLLAALRLLDRVASSHVPVLVLGESGSGKELFARAIHHASPRKTARFLSENCGAIPEPLLEATLFGHEKGAFTGAVGARPGLFELADRGTLFLDEVGEMSLAMQTRLLRVLEDGEVRPLGATRSRKVDVRVVAATHRDLPAMVREGRFREDLLFRLRVVELRVPPLRERSGDVGLLVAHLVKKHAEGRVIKVSAAAMVALSSYAWPGNVRQLENEIRRAIVLCDGVIEPETLSPEVRGLVDDRSSGTSLRSRLDALERELIREAMGKTGGNQSKAAQLLGVSRFGLQKMLARLQISGGK